MNRPPMNKGQCTAISADMPEKIAWEETVDQTLEASFPASDPPNWTLGVGDPIPSTQKNMSGVDSGNFGETYERCSNSNDDQRVCKSACVEFPAWMNEEALCGSAPHAVVFDKKVILPIFPT
ncbi:hypothetical protein [Hyphococcus sp.]|uniref:hypothetical protein n=1 Tax=Hyphococcus sp. TaxID=2038636 RepID=UPI00207FA4CA|nr:MAG: hypothetical protein DHS20C04_08830 [Marinicaulis sp.]